MDGRTVERIYGGFLGMDAGMRLGAPLETPFWDYDSIRAYYGDIRDYLRQYKNYAADDDVNGPVYFLRALTDRLPEKTFTAAQAGETWLNYTRCGRGMFWWGGEQLSTEHRAYMNLKRGVPVPISGSAALNGIVAAEQIGGQIFSDTWGLICPGDPAQAARYARAMAAVSHDGEALHGAAFIAGCIAAAFQCDTVDQVLDAGLSQLPTDCAYRRVVEAVRAFHADAPTDFRACRDTIWREFGPDKYPGYCHIIPNAGVCVLALLYGGGDLGRSIEISVMCGFDTDCNASSIGTILGVLLGPEGVPSRYRAPINDAVVLSGVSGYLNILDAAAYAVSVADAAARLRGETLPAPYRVPAPGQLLLDFALPGSTHGLELSDHASYVLRNVPCGGAPSGRCGEVLIDGKRPAPAELSFKAFYTRADFDNEQYDPVFSPRVYPGQRVSCRMQSLRRDGSAVAVTPFVRTAMTDRVIDLPTVPLPTGAWTEVAFIVPPLSGDQAHDIGWRVAVTPGEAETYTWGRLLVAEIAVTGPMDYAIDMGIQRREFGECTPFSSNDGDCAPEKGALRLRTGDEGQAFTGNYYMRDTVLSAVATPEAGESALLLLRGQGARRYYALGLGRDGAAILRRDGGELACLARTAYPWQLGESLRLRAEAVGDTLSLYADDRLLLQVCDDRFAYGMAGVCHSGAGESLWRDFHIRAGL